MSFVTSFLLASFLILWGIAHIVGSIFKIRFPLMRVFFAVILISTGIMILNTFVWHRVPLLPQESPSGKIIKTAVAHRNFVIGKKIFDFSENVLDTATFYTIGSIFGNIIIKLNQSKAASVRVNSILSAVTFPDKSLVSLGSYTYENQGDSSQAPAVIEVTAILSAVEITY